MGTYWRANAGLPDGAPITQQTTTFWIGSDVTTLRFPPNTDQGKTSPATCVSGSGCSGTYKYNQPLSSYHTGGMQVLMAGRCGALHFQ